LPPIPRTAQIELGISQRLLVVPAAGVQCDELNKNGFGSLPVLGLHGGVELSNQRVFAQSFVPIRLHLLQLFLADGGLACSRGDFYGNVIFSGAILRDYSYWFLVKALSGGAKHLLVIFAIRNSEAGELTILIRLELKGLAVVFAGKDDLDIGQWLAAGRDFSLDPGGGGLGPCRGGGRQEEQSHHCCKTEFCFHCRASGFKKSLKVLNFMPLPFSVGGLAADTELDH